MVGNDLSPRIEFGDGTTLPKINGVSYKEPQKLYKNDHRVSIIKDTDLVYPDLWLEIYVSGPPGDQRGFAEMFTRAKCTRATDPEKADIVVFTGGDDVNPIYYDEDAHPTTKWDAKRDEADIKLYELCLSQGIPMFGVCRGAQFGAVMNGCKLFQDVDNHHSSHAIFDHKSKIQVQQVSSVHHQMVKFEPNTGMEVIATAGRSKTRWLNDKDKEEGNYSDVEAFFFRDTCFFGVQGHPEYRGYHQFTIWTLKKIEELIVNNPDLAYIKGSRIRLKEEFLKEREARWSEALTATEVKEEKKKELN